MPSCLAAAALEDESTTGVIAKPLASKATNTLLGLNIPPDEVLVYFVLWPLAHRKTRERENPKNPLNWNSYSLWRPDRHVRLRGGHNRVTVFVPALHQPTESLESRTETK